MELRVVGGEFRARDERANDDGAERVTDEGDASGR